MLNLTDSFVFAQIIGLYLAVLAMVLLSRANYYRALLEHAKSPGFATLIASSLCVLFGIFLVLLHNVWPTEVRIMTSMFSWVFFLSATMWLATPEQTLMLMKKICVGKGYYGMVAFLFFLAFFLIMKGFYVHINEASSY